MQGRPGDDPRFGRAAPRSADPGAAGRRSLGPVPGGPDHRSFRSRERLRVARHSRAHEPMGRGPEDRGVLRSAGHLSRGSARTRPFASGHVRGRRRQPFADRRGVRRLHVRRRGDRDGRCSGDRRDLAQGARDDPHRMEWTARGPGHRQGHDAPPLRHHGHGWRALPGGAVCPVRRSRRCRCRSA